MTGRSDLDRGISAYLESRSTNRAPDGLLDAALTRIDRTRQRPGWVIPERWLPTRVTGGVARLGNAAVLLAIVALFVALAVAIGVFVGSRHRLPPPYGLAAPGLITLDRGGYVFVANPDGTGMTQLTSGSGEDSRPTFSPDGTLIAYESATALMVMGADGRHPITLEDSIAVLGDFAWSPDSRRIAFGGKMIGSDSSHIYVVDVDHPGATRLGGADLLGEEPSWSPDGKQIAFKLAYPCCGPSGLPDELWLMDADGSNAHRLWQEDTVGNWWNSLWNTAWSPDSTRLAFLAHGVGGAYDVYVINRDGTGVKNITQSPEEEMWPSWSPDGTRIAFPRMSGGINAGTSSNAGTFYVVDPDGSNPIPLLGAYVNSNTAVWSPDGKRIFGYVYNPNLNTNDAIAVFDPSGSAPPTTIPAVDFGSISVQRLAP